MKQVETFYTTYDWMVEIGLSSNDLNLYALIYSFTREGKFWMASRSYLAKRIGCSVITVYKSIQFLQDNGLLEKREVMKGNVLSVEYKAIKKLNPIKKLNSSPIKKLNSPIKKINSSPIKKLNTNNKDNNKYNNKENNNNSSLRSELNIAHDDGFDEFWMAYDYKKSKATAQKAWRNLSKKDREAAMQGVEPYKQDCRRCQRSMQYAATYLHKRTWEDDFTKTVDYGNKRNNPIDNIERAQQQAIRESMEFIREAKERDSQVQDTMPL